jgi:hypothetical protein
MMASSRSIARPVPIGKELRATLEGKEVAVTRLAQGACQREGPHIQQRVALTDGAEALQAQVVTYVPEHTLVLGCDPRHGVSMGHRHCSAEGDPSASHEGGTHLLGATAERRDGHGNSRVGGRGI